jgi:uncharacterized coiled-coil protein SlyX
VAKEAIKDMEAVVNAKAETIAELSEYMNDQAERLAQLQQQVGRGEGLGKDAEEVDDGKDGLSLKERVVELEEILQQKEGTIAEFGEYIEEKSTRVREL